MKHKSAEEAPREKPSPDLKQRYPDDRSGIDIDRDSAKRYRSSVEKLDRSKEKDIDRALRSE